VVKTLVLRALFVVSLAGFAAELGAVCTSGSRSLRVPEDCGSIAEAVSALASGGTIDIATGTYSFSASGLDLGKKNKAMTLQARALGQVTFTGNNASPIVRIDNGTSASQPIVFEGIRFVNGYSATGNRAGGVTLLNAEASFVDCTFSNNRMMESTTGGGAIGLYGGSRAVVVRSAFTTNTAKNNGGAIYAVRNSGQNPTSVWVHASTFSGNSTAIAGFTVTSSGGAIYVRDAELFVADSTFEGNAAGWVGGAIYAWGDFATSSPYCNYTAPATDILITGSRFDDNRADDAASPSQVPQTQGGAIHTENCVRVRVYRSLFERNWADWGGAISVDHAASVVEQSVFRYNYATVPGGPAGTAHNFSNCSLLGMSANGGTKIFCWGGASVGGASAILGVRGGIVFVDYDFVQQGTSGTQIQNGVLQIGAAGFYDSTGAGISAIGNVGFGYLRNATVPGGSGLTAMYGSGNVGVGIAIPGAQSMQKPAGIVPSITGAGGDFSIGGSLVASSFDPATGLYSAATIATTWANWAVATPGGFLGGGAHNCEKNAHMVDA